MTIGVTGGIGSGKSTVCELFGRWGAHLIDADRVGHEVLDDPRISELLCEAFGADIVQSDGSLDRRVLGQRAFSSDEMRRQLTDIVWLEIGRRLRESVAVARDVGQEMLVIEASLLFERGDPEGLYETIVVVTAPEAVRIERTKKRLRISEEEVRSRMRYQMPEDEKIKRADHVIVNDTGTDVLESRSREVWLHLTAEG